ncbi:hypothetical protein VT84_06485 [Gemmata sp. SH-PL17]|uniref:tetratricopeptide repeat protein n=1 Tax=Gemmata sp. SH-PL17 TaxID=1630693 RepID=UPI00078E5575|nr:hypothetical protein [Gemmata sp. SH-PL17]AMV24024.1 hypothetical protein VT84_06485 [Gemmata sp. SH-PL17]
MMGIAPLVLFLVAPPVTDEVMEQVKGEAFKALITNERPKAERLAGIAAAYYRGRAGYDRAYAGALNTLAVAQARNHKHADADRTFQELCRMFQGKWGAGQIATPAPVINYIFFLTNQSRFREAEQWLTAHLTNTALCYPDEPDYMAKVLAIFAQLYRVAGRLEDARVCGRRAVELYGDKAAYETGVAEASIELVSVYCVRGELELAEKALEAVGRSAMFRYRVEELRAECLLARGRPRAALLALEASRQRLEGEKPSDVFAAVLHEHVGTAAFQLGDTVAGKKFLLGAIAACEREYGRDSQAVLRLCEKLVRLCPAERDHYAERIAAVRDKLKVNEPKGLKAVGIKLP